MKYLITILCGLTFTGGLAYAEVKLGYVDLQRALMEVNEGKSAKKQLEKMKSDRQKKLDVRQNELRDLQKNLEAQQAFMQEDVRRQKKQEFAQRLQELQATYLNLQKELAAEEAKLTKGIYDRMGRILGKIGEKQGYTMILEKSQSSVLWAPRHLDLTNDLIRRYNAGQGKKK
jgi:outer membrane protein